MIPIEVTRLIRLLRSEYPHLTPATGAGVWNAILADVPYLIACEAVQDWVDRDPHRRQFPHAWQLREASRILLGDKTSNLDPEWTLHWIRGYWCKARLGGINDDVRWAAYCLEVRWIEIAGVSTNLVEGYGAMHDAFAAAMRRLDSVHLPMTAAQLRQLVPLEAIAA